MKVGWTSLETRECWACRSHLSEAQLVCTKCSSWQNWRRFLGLTNTTLALLIALASILAILATNIGNVRRELFPLREVFISGYFNADNLEISLDVFNFGDVPASLASNIRCVFRANGPPQSWNNDTGEEIEFWASGPRFVGFGEPTQVKYTSQVGAFAAGESQVICHSALSYLGRQTPQEYFLITIVPNAANQYWPIETWPDSRSGIEAFYPRDFL